MSTNMRIGIYHEATHKAGSAGYYEMRNRGQVSVYQDGRRYIYTRPSWCKRAEFKAALSDVFGKLRGEWPIYNTE